MGSSGVGLSALERTYALLSPLVFRGAQLVERMRGASDEELQSRLGYMLRGDAPLVWFHGASAGEMAAAAGLSATLRKQGHHFAPAYTATNRAGIDYIRRAEPDARAIGLVPWDISHCIVRALDRWQPRALFIVETELWPRLVFEAYRRAIPVFSVSARIYPADLARYNAIKSFIGPTLRRITRILAQDETERGRFIQIGAPAERCVSAGNLKYISSEAQFDGTAALRAEIGIKPEERVVVCGSIHGDEVVNLFESIGEALPDDVRLIVAPRHLSAVDVIERCAAQHGWKSVRRSSRPASGKWRLMILDTMGELGHFYSLAICAIVGGGFERHGGHNPFEAVKGGAPVLFGSHFFHFDAEARALSSLAPEAQVSETADIGQVLDRWLGDPALRARIHALQRSMLPDAGAIAACYISTLEPFLTAAGV
jgi:3-deoxy-D-manno-octulosonic-acid transferase